MNSSILRFLRVALVSVVAVAAAAGCGGSKEAYDCGAIDEAELGAAASFRTADSGQSRGGEGEYRWVSCSWETPDTVDSQGETLIRFVSADVGAASLFDLWAGDAQQADSDWTPMEGFGERAMYTFDASTALLTLRVQTEDHSISVGIHNRESGQSELLDQAVAVATLIDES